ncbi:MAG: hypothetical protein IT270_01090 [Saprospiraceae bacterium]|nr:hypothetical protein [Saprospiraceae bacterium]
MTVSDFIKTVFLQEYKTVIQHPYVAFSLIFNSIELLGKCLNDDSDFDSGKPGVNFKKAIKELFDSKYHDLHLFDPMRNGFAHTFRPKKNRKIRLKSRSELETLNLNIPNLANTSDGQQILFIEDFYEDFSNACNKIIDKIKSGEIQHPKLHKPFLEFKSYELSVDNGEVVFVLNS